MSSGLPVQDGWIQEHKVCYEVLPYYLLSDGRRVQVGFEVHMYAQPEPGVNADPGGTESEEIFQELFKIASSVRPEAPATRCKVEPFDSTLYIRPENRLKPEVELKMLITHSTDLFDPVDEEERECLHRIEQSLASLGVRRNVFTQ